MRNWYLAVALVIACAMPAFAGYIPIGAGTSQNARPMNDTYVYMYDQALYLQTEIASAVTITGLSWYLNANTDNGNATIDVYINEVPAATTALTATPVAVGTLVYSGVINLAMPAGWKEITLTTPYVYANVNNLVITVCQSNSSNDTGASNFTYSSVATNMHAYVSIGSDTTPVGCPPASQSVNALRPNLRITYLDPSGEDCANARAIHCSETLVGDTTSLTTNDIDRTNGLGGCTDIGDALGNEMWYHLGSTTAGNHVVATVTGNVDVYLITTAAGCTGPFTCLAAGDTTLDYYPAAGTEDFYLIVDYDSTGADSGGAFTINVKCAPYVNIAGPGTGATSTTNFPFYTYYQHFETQYCIPLSAMTAAGLSAGDNIIKLAWLQTTGTLTAGQLAFSVYLQNVADPCTDICTTAANPTGVDLYATGKTFSGAPGWKEIALDATFTYTGGAVIVSICENNTGGYTSGIYFETTAMTPNGWEVHSDTVTYDCNFTTAETTKTCRNVWATTAFVKATGTQGDSCAWTNSFNCSTPASGDLTAAGITDNYNQVTYGCGTDYAGADEVWAFVLASNQALTFTLNDTTDPTMDMIISTTCPPTPATTYGCYNNTASFMCLSAGTYYVIVDMPAASTGGAYTVTAACSSCPVATILDSFASPQDAAMEMVYDARWCGVPSVWLVHETDPGVPNVYMLDVATHSVARSFDIGTINGLSTHGCEGITINQDGNLVTGDYNGDVAVTHDDWIYAFDPNTGVITGWVDVDGTTNDSTDATNINAILGIEWIPGTVDEYLVTDNNTTKYFHHIKIIWGNPGTWHHVYPAWTNTTGVTGLSYDPCHNWYWLGAPLSGTQVIYWATYTPGSGFTVLGSESAILCSTYSPLFPLWLADNGYNPGIIWGTNFNCASGSTDLVGIFDSAIPQGTCPAVTPQFSMHLNGYTIDAPCDVNLETGEQDLMMHINLCNDCSAGTITGVSGTLVSLTTGVTVTNPTQSFADIDPGLCEANATAFEIDIDMSVACGSTIALRLDVTHSSGSMSLTLNPTTADTVNNYIGENFDATATGTLPTGWTTYSFPDDTCNAPPYSNWTVQDPGLTSPLAWIDSDAAFCTTGRIHQALVSPAVDTTAATNLTLSFFAFLNEYLGSSLTAEVWDGTQWVTLLTLTANTSANYNYDVLAYKNAAFQVRFTYDDITGWEYYAGIDDVFVRSFTCDYECAPVTPTPTYTNTPAVTATPTSGGPTPTPPPVPVNGSTGIVLLIVLMSIMLVAIFGRRVRA